MLLTYPVHIILQIDCDRKRSWFIGDRYSLVRFVPGPFIDEQLEAERCRENKEISIHRITSLMTIPYKVP